MFKVNIANSSQNLSWSASFSSEVEAQSWLNSQIGKPHRLPEREVPIESEYAQEDVLEVIEEEIEGVMQQTKVRLKAQYTSEIVDITSQHNAEQSKIARLQAGKAARQACESVMDLISGYNLERELTAEQVSQMAATFAPIIQLLQVSRPSSAKALISAIEPDGVLVTADMKQDCLSLLANY
jgi:hypothetical protein